MWCRRCSIETTEDKCPECGAVTEKDRDIEIYWCKDCKIPVIQFKDDIHKSTCPVCRQNMKYMSSDLRPVFPEERLLLELLLNKEPNSLVKKSVWASDSRYYIDGKATLVSATKFRAADADELKTGLDKYKSENSYDYFNKNIADFVNANANRLYYLKDEAGRFIQYEASKFPEENIVLSFSGGKDSTVTADLVIKSLGNPSLVHIFGDTTLEFPVTVEYARRYRENNPEAIFKIAKNKEQDFYEVCSDIGPPARMMRWCCSMFKTGPITRVLNNLYRNKQVLTFYGIRKAESISRSKYDRVASSESVKIQKQTVASPIFFWLDIDVWLYMLAEQVDFNDAYRLGYDRVGCWCCPNNNQRAQFLSRIYMAERSKKWREFLIDFAKRIGKPDAEEYVDSGKWKARQGGNGLAAAGDVKIRFTNCTSEDHAKIYKLVKPYDDSFLNMMVPFGIVKPELGRKLINETIIVDARNQSVPIISIQPFSQEGYDYAVKIKTLNVADHDKLQLMLGYQVRKFNACRQCLKCESVCKQGAISIVGGEYYINPDKCIHCHMCVNNKYLTSGCLMDKYLKTKG